MRQRIIMPNTPKRPDVEGIEARAETLLIANAIDDSHFYLTLDRLASKDIPALIAWVEALETRQAKLEAVVEMARALSMDGSWRHLLEANLPGKNLLKSLAALGEGDL